LNVPMKYWLSLILAIILILIVSQTNPSINLVLIPALILAFKLWKRKMGKNETIADERDELVWSKATVRTFQASMMLLALEVGLENGCKGLLLIDIAAIALLHLATMLYYYRRYG